MSHNIRLFDKREGRDEIIDAMIIKNGKVCFYLEKLLIIFYIIYFGELRNKRNTSEINLFYFIFVN